jgi:plasmid replication initiation protein
LNKSSCLEAHYINNNFNEILNLISLSEERALYVLIKALKKRYNQCLHWGFQDEEVEYIKDSEDNLLIKKFNIPTYDVKLAYKEAKIRFNDTKDLFCNLPFVITKYMPNGSIRKQGLFNELFYNVNYERFELDVNERFYEFIKLENKEMDKYFKVYHNEFFRLTGKYSRAMYRLVSMFSNNKYFSQNIQTLRNYFNQREYENPEFMRMVIKRSIKEIEEKTNFKITYKTIKKGRNIHKLTFTVIREDAKNEKK